MTYRNAKKLHNEDEVMHKYTGEILTIVEVKIDELHKEVYVMCHDGEWYHHRTIQ